MCTTNLGYLFDVGFEASEYTTSEASPSVTAYIEVSGNVTSRFNITVQAMDGTATSKVQLHSLQKRMDLVICFMHI